MNGYEINKFAQNLISISTPNLIHLHISSNRREDKCYPTDQETCPHIGLSSFELCGTRLLTRERRILSEINMESALTCVWSVERYKVAVLKEFSRTLSNV